MADGSESIKPVGEADGGEAAGTEVQETGASSRGGPQDVLADPGPVAKTPDRAQKSVEQAVVQPQGESPIIAAPVSDPAAESVSEVKPSGPEAEPSEVKASAEKAPEQDPGDADGNHNATRDDEGVKADGVAGKLEQSAVKEDGVAQNATASATRPVAPDLVPKEKETEAEQPIKPAEAIEVPKASASVLSAVTEATTVPSGPATSQAVSCSLLLCSTGLIWNIMLRTLMCSNLLIGCGTWKPADRNTTRFVVYNVMQISVHQ